MSLGAVILLSVIGFQGDRMIRDDRVAYNVSAGNQKLSGYTEGDVMAYLDSFLVYNAKKKYTFIVKDLEFSRTPQDFGLLLDYTKSVNALMRAQKEGTFFEQYGLWLRSFITPSDVTNHLITEGVLVNMLEEFSFDAALQQPDAGRMFVDEIGQITFELPQHGEGFDLDNVKSHIIEAIVSDEKSKIRLSIVPLPPLASEDDFMKEVENLRQLIRAPITVTTRDEDFRIPISVDEIISMVMINNKSNPRNFQQDLNFKPNKSYIDLDVEKISELFTTQKPIDATFDIALDETVSVVPHHEGFGVQTDDIKEAIFKAVLREDRIAYISKLQIIQPELTTEDAENLDIQHLVSSFTTYHACCQERVTNIHLAGDTVDNLLLQPSEEVSLNEVIGERTTEEGYQEAGMIWNGRLIDATGGGVSQFATTFYNTLYWGGYNIVSHRPHSQYFTRYPLGIEATISWPSPDLVFQNDREAGLLIRVEYSSTSLTVKMYGNNYGHSVVGEQKNGETNIEITKQGDSTRARKVVSLVIPVSVFDSQPIIYIPDSILPLGQEYIADAGQKGQVLRVERRIFEGDASSVESFSVQYNPTERTVHVNPCVLPAHARVNIEKGYDYSHLIC